MNKGIAVATILTGLLMLPVAASATHLVSVTGEGDCNGWVAETVVHWRTGINEGNLDYVVTIADAEGNVLETITWAGIVSREDGACYRQFYQFAGEWSIFAPAGDYVASGVFHLSAPWSGGVEESTVEFSEDFFCGSVPTTDTSWSVVKDLYR